MKTAAFIVVLLLTTLAIHSQSKNPESDKFYQEAEKELIPILNIDKTSLNLVFDLIKASNSSMYSIVKNKKGTKSEKLRLLNAVAAERDEKIQKILTSEQVTKLRAFMSSKNKKT